MALGTVKFFDVKKGWGMITGDDGADIFVHYTGIAGEGFRKLTEGQKVSYDAVPSGKFDRLGNEKLKAVNVTVL